MSDVEIRRNEIIELLYTYKKYSISAFPSQETACTLSDILMNDVEEKYFLSPKQQEVLLFKPTAATKGSASTPPKD